MVDVNGKVSDDFRVHYPSFRLLSPSVIYIRNNTGGLRWWFMFAILALQETDSLPVSSRPAWSVKDLFEEKRREDREQRREQRNVFTAATVSRHFNAEELIFDHF